tara:strand:+ start:9561 stop:10091 length:531 start_codon:yes stop_codon:yes gene_type:complete
MTSILRVNSIKTTGNKTILNSTGSILQVVQTTKTDTFSTTSTSFTDITGMTVNITPSSTSNKVLVLVHCPITMGDAGGGFTLLRDSTEIFRGDAASSRQRFTATGLYGSSSNNNVYSGGVGTAVFLDSPGVTSQLTYKLQAKIRNTTLYVGLTLYDVDNDNASRNPSSITVMEIAG